MIPAKNYTCWQDRTWDAVKFVATIATSLAVASAIALIGLLIGKS